MTPPDSNELSVSGEEWHHRALESLYASAPINNLFDSRLEITDSGKARIHFKIDDRHYHAAGAAHGTIYFKMLDDAAFYACNTLSSNHFLLTTAFNMNFTSPVRTGDVIAEGKWVSGKRRVFIGESRLLNSDGEEIARGTGTFMRSHIALSNLDGYNIDRS